MDGKQLTTIRDGVNRWQYISMGQYPVKKGQDEPSPSSWLPFHLQVYPQDSNKQYALAGRDSTFGAPADIVKIVDPSNPRATVTVWIDRHRWGPTVHGEGDSCLEAGRPGQRSRRVIYKDIRKTSDGRFFPFKIEWHEGGVLTQAGVYKAVGINENLPDSLFQPMNASSARTTVGPSEGREAIPHPWLAQDVPGHRGVGFYLLAQVPDVDAKGLLVAGALGSPDVVP